MLTLMFPAYNEAENLIKFLPPLSAFLCARGIDCGIMVIDDGSRDSTRQLSSRLKLPLPLKVISHDKNKGVGEVFRTGFTSMASTAGDDDFLIVLEGDGTSDYTLIPALLKKLQDGADIVIASRYIKGGAYKNFPLKRHILSRVGNAVLMMVFRNRKIRDYTIFFRGYRMGLIKKALGLYKEKFITSKTFLANTEALVNLIKLTDNIEEVPFIYSYDLKIGKSKMPVAKTLLDYLKFLSRKIFR